MSDPIVIVGAGCAGLSLAVELVAAGVRTPVEIIDSRSEFTRDRTWCGWNLQPHSFQECVSHRWSRWSVRHAGREVVHRCTVHPYEHISSADFYEVALQKLRNRQLNTRVEISLGETVKHVSSGTVRTNRRTLTATHIFDSRPRFNGNANPSEPCRTHGSFDGLIQHFEGWEVETKQPVFNPTVATLMDFSQSAPIRFFYVLPFTAHHALVEVTYFAPILEPIYEAPLKQWLEAKGEYRIIYRERGAIPMSTAPIASPPKGVTRIGAFRGRGETVNRIRVCVHSAAQPRPCTPPHWRTEAATPPTATLRPGPDLSALFANAPRTRRRDLLRPF